MKSVKWVAGFREGIMMGMVFRVGFKKMERKKDKSGRQTISSRSKSLRLYDYIEIKIEKFIILQTCYSIRLYFRS